MNTLLITGGAGFIGCHCVRLALTQGWRVVVVDKLTYAGHRINLADVWEHPQFEFHQADIGDHGVMSTLLRDRTPQGVINFAAETHVDRSIEDVSPFLRTNVLGVANLLEVSLNFWNTLAPDHQKNFRFVQISTDEVYGSLGETDKFRENTPFAPNSPYAASKAAADHLVHAYGHTYGLPVLTTHCSNNYGAFQFPEKLIPMIILNAVQGRDLPIYGDGLHVRDWLHVTDHCQAILRILAVGRPGERYNVGGNNERNNLELVDIICRTLEDELPARDNISMKKRGLTAYTQLKTHVKDRPGHDRRYAIDADKLHAESGWSPSVALEDGLKTTVRWYLDNPVWCDTISTHYQRERLGLR
ncbi:MAG: dTDP-glucose 4,6-dehydratase [Magnetococcales bacterium]|nr:dTDP-glucose 4,6-dehydratase [Magnetococcales bacterium]